MKEILFYKGKHEIITLPEFASKAKKFYDKLFGLFRAKGYTYKTVETISEKKVGKHISEQTLYLVGHSRGATRILKEFVAENNPQIKGVIVFDPKQTCKEEWNKLQIPKLLFVSTKEQTQDYTGFQNKIEIQDGHYFNNSNEKVFPILEKFIE
jgi:hypothetical protein|tara:strand:+ start:108 stop:566 length:459 start_codon:yes stop_codon:yes gene_type:complete